MSAVERRVTARDVSALVAQSFRLSVADLVARSRRREVLRPRQIAMFLARRHTTASFETLAQAFRRDSATVQHSVVVVERLELEDPAFAKTLARLDRAVRQLAQPKGDRA